MTTPTAPVLVSTIQAPASGRARFSAAPTHVTPSVTRSHCSYPQRDRPALKVVNRLERARILENPDTPTVWVILSENVIRTVVGGPDIMAEQLRHIAGLGRSGRVLVQVLPHRVGAHATMNSLVKLMRFADAPDMAYVEALHTGSLTDDPSLVRGYRDAYDLARAAAMPPEASLDLLESVAEDYAHECPPHS